MIIKSSEFITSAVKPTQYPQADLPEVAFAGRSNVGKSSLINAILNRKRLVKTSSTPGRTQLINFFNINNAFLFVDLPGYGYAKVPASVQKTWGPMIEKYLTSRNTLKGVVLIMDIRRNPGQEEVNFLSWMDHFGIPYILVLTKTDKLSKSKQIKCYNSISESLNVQKKDMILFSAKSKKGKDLVWKNIESLIGSESSPAI